MMEYFTEVFNQLSLSTVLAIAAVGWLVLFLLFRYIEYRWIIRAIHLSLPDLCVSRDMFIQASPGQSKVMQLMVLQSLVMGLASTKEMVDLRLTFGTNEVHKFVYECAVRKCFPASLIPEVVIIWSEAKIVMREQVARFGGKLPFFGRSIEEAMTPDDPPRFSYLRLFLWPTRPKSF